MEKSIPRPFKHFVYTANDPRFGPGESRPKRRRVRVACTECSARKVKCSGSRPVCHECRRNESSCVYRDKRPAEPESSQDTSDEAPLEGGNDGSEAATARASNDPLPLPDCSVLPPQSHSFSNEALNTVNNWSALNLRLDLSGAPLVVSMASPPSAFRPYLPLPAPEHQNNLQDTSKIRIPYFRWFGPTGIVPGFTKVLVDLRQTESERSSSTYPSPTQIESPAESRTQTQHSPNRTSSMHRDEYLGSSLFDSDDEIMPKPDVLEHLLSIFFDYFGCHFPFYQRESFMELVRAKSVPALLLNTMCALASRFSYDPRIRRDPIYLCGEVFGDKAKQLIVVLLAVPSYDLVASLLMLSWYEFGCNRDVGMWMYTGMAIRMAQDLGMHKGNEEPGKPPRQENDANEVPDNSATHEEHQQDEDDDGHLQLNLFWSIYFIDRIISLGTGRPLTLRDEQISCPLPADLSETNNSMYPNPFPHMIRIMTIQGKVNEEISTIQQSEILSTLKKNTLFSLQDQLIDIYLHLDDRLTFNVKNLRDQVALGQGGSFLLLHIWFHAVIITLHRPGLMFGKDAIVHTLEDESLLTSLSSAISITAILDLAELIDEKTISGTPFLNQAIYIAGLAFISESETHSINLSRGQQFSAQNPVSQQTDSNTQFEEAILCSRINADPLVPSMPPDSNRGPESTFVPDTTAPSANGQFPEGISPSLLHSQIDSSSGQRTATNALLQYTSRRNYGTCLHAIAMLKLFWRGIGWIQSTMEQKAKGIVQTDPSEESVDPESRIELRDAGMLKRLLTARRYGRRSAATVPSGVLYPAFLNPGAIEAWEVRNNQGWGTFELAPNEMIFGDGYNDLTWSAVGPEVGPMGN